MLPHEQVGPKNFYKLWNNINSKLRINENLLQFKLQTAFIINYKDINLHAYNIGIFLSFACNM